MTSEAATALVYHEDMIKHDTGPGHPERPERLTTTHAALREAGALDTVAVVSPREATEEELGAVHPREYISRIRSAAGPEPTYFGPDTVMSEGSYRAALLAAGASLTAVDALEGETESFFCLVRPPGHHATSGEAMGFCLLNNLAVAHRYAQTRGVEKTLLIDFDAHHGNGSQDIFYTDSSLLYVSLHQFPLYPGTGLIEETGAETGAGFNVNLPLVAGSGDRAYKEAFEQVVRPVAAQYEPDLVMVSAGYDGHFADPITNLNLTVAGVTGVVQGIKGIAREAGAKLIFSLEGGYDLLALPASVLATINVLGSLGLKVDEPYGRTPPPDAGLGDMLDTVRARLRPFWNI